MEDGGADELHVNQFGSSLARESSHRRDMIRGKDSGVKNAYFRMHRRATSISWSNGFEMTARSSETRELGVQRTGAPMRSEGADGVLQE